MGSGGTDTRINCKYGTLPVDFRQVIVLVIRCRNRPLFFGNGDENNTRKVDQGGSVARDLG